MANNLDKLMRGLVRKHSERTLKTQEFIARDNYFLGILSQLLGAAVQRQKDGGDSVSADPVILADVSDLIEGHHKAFCDHMLRLQAETDQLIEKAREYSEKYEEMDKD